MCVSGTEADLSTAVTVEIPDIEGCVDKSIYDSKNRLYVLYNNIASLFDPSTKKLIPIELLKKVQKIERAMISPNADYIAVIREECRGVYQTIVWQRLSKSDLEKLFKPEVIIE